MSRTYTVPAAGTSSVSQQVAFLDSDSNYFYTSDGSQFYVRKDDGTIQMLNNIFKREAESRSYEVPN